MIYEFEQSFVMDSSAFTAHFDPKATQLDEALAIVMKATT